MREIKRVIEIKNGSKWGLSHVVTDETEIYKCLSTDLIAKKLNNCSYIKSIKRIPNYDGTQTITVDYGNGCRSIYTVIN